jgi:hypothetical protein
MVAIVQSPFEAAIATWVDLGDPHGPAGADGRTHQRQAGVVSAVLAAARAAAGISAQVEASPDTGLNIQVLGHAAGDVGSPAHIAARMCQRC